MLGADVTEQPVVRVLGADVTEQPVARVLGADVTEQPVARVLGADVTEQPVDAPASVPALTASRRIVVRCPTCARGAGAARRAELGSRPP